MVRNYTGLLCLMRERHESLFENALHSLPIRAHLKRSHQATSLNVIDHCFHFNYCLQVEQRLLCMKRITLRPGSESQFVSSLLHPPAHVSSPSSRRDGSGGELGTATLSCFPYFVSFIYEFSSGSCEMSVFELKNN